MTESGDESQEYIEAWELERLWPIEKDAVFRASSKENSGGVRGPMENE